MINRQIHNDTRIPVINIWIETQFKNVHAELKDSDGEAYRLEVKPSTEASVLD